MPPSRTLRDLLVDLHDRKVGPDGQKVTKSAAALAMSIDRRTLQSWHTEGEWQQLPDIRNLVAALDYYEATDEERVEALSFYSARRTETATSAA